MSSHKKSGFTLIDVLLSAVVLLIAISGSIQYRYHSALQMRRAKMYTTAAELAQTLLETWKGKNADPTFDAQSYFSGSIPISTDTGPPSPADHTLNGSYAIQWNDYDYKTTLSSKDLGDLTILNVAVSWPLTNTGIDKEFRLTSYIRQ